MTLSGLLLLLLAVAGYMVSLVAFPYRPCLVCRNRPAKRCPRCRGLRKVRRIGASLVCGAVLDVRAELERARERRRGNR